MDRPIGHVGRAGAGPVSTKQHPFERAQREVRDRELRRWIDRTLPALRERLAAAQKLTAALSS